MRQYSPAHARSVHINVIFDIIAVCEHEITITLIAAVRIISIRELYRKKKKNRGTNELLLGRE